MNERPLWKAECLSRCRDQSESTALPPDVTKKAGSGGAPEYQDTDVEGYPENREVNGKGRKRIAVGFRSGGHAGNSLPITAEGPGAGLFMGYMDQTDSF